MCAEFIILPLVSPSFDRMECIEVNKIRELSYNGLDGTQPEDRAVAWLVLLGVYPRNPRDWVSRYTEIKQNYWFFATEHGLADWHTRNLANQMSIEKFQLKNNSLMGIVHGDIVRTGRTIFFLPPKPIPLKDDSPEEKKYEEDYMYQFGEHARRLERILYTFASMNVGLGYMQGFNELVVPFYYVLFKAQSLLNNDLDLVEALAYQCLQTLLTESTLNEFYTTADNSSIIMHQLDDFRGLLAKHLPDVSAIVERLKIHPLLYSFRWFNLLFSQEHDLPTLLSIWDCMLAHFNLDNPKELMECVFYVGVGHLNNIKGRLDRTNYGTTISALQNMTDLDIKAILAFANECWSVDHPPEKKFNKLRQFFKL